MAEPDSLDKFRRALAGASEAVENLVGADRLVAAPDQLQDPAECV